MIRTWQRGDVFSQKYREEPGLPNVEKCEDDYL